jgi:hypothetical protein
MDIELDGSFGGQMMRNQDPRDEIINVHGFDVHYYLHGQRYPRQATVHRYIHCQPTIVRAHPGARGACRPSGDGV